MMPSSVVMLIRPMAQTMDPMVGFAGGGATTPALASGAGFGGIRRCRKLSGRLGAAGGGISAAVFFLFAGGKDHRRTH
jgi:hypothetical protein